MRIHRGYFLIALFLSLTLSGSAQSISSKYGDSFTSYRQTGTGKGSTNEATPRSNYQQLRDFQKSETDRKIAQKLEKQIQAPIREAKEKEVQAKFVRLKLEEQDEEKRKQEFQQSEERKELQQQMLLKYTRQLYKKNPDKKGDVPQSSLKSLMPTPTPEKTSSLKQEAMKTEALN